MIQLMAFAVLSLIVFRLSECGSVRSRFSRLPVWGKGLAWVVIFSLVGGVSQAFNERAFLTASAQETVAWILHIGFLVGTFGGASWVGNAIYKKLQYRTKTLGLVLGIVAGALIVFVVGHGLYEVLVDLPEVGWRLERQALLLYR